MINDCNGQSKSPAWVMTGACAVFCLLAFALYYLLTHFDLNSDAINRFLNVWLPGAIGKLLFLFVPLLVFEAITPGRTFALINSDRWTATTFWSVIVVCLTYLLTWA
jgi:hypothetical protein